MYAINLRGDFLFSEAFYATQPLNALNTDRVEANIVITIQETNKPFQLLSKQPSASLYQAFLTEHIKRLSVRDDVFRPDLGVV